VTVIKVVDEIPWAHEEWDLYRSAFEALNAMTVQRHLMNRTEFTEVMRDRRIDKYRATNDAGGLVGLSIYTNVLEAVPLISPAYFARRWPALAAGRKIWYCGFVAVPGHEPGVFRDLVEAMYRTAEQHGGVIALDICRYNIEEHKIDHAIRHMLEWISVGRVRCEEADAQVFMVYETSPEVPA
jgi:hypothetical protein